MQEHASDMMSAASAASDAVSSKISTSIAAVSAGGIIVTGQYPNIVTQPLMHIAVCNLTWIDVFQITGWIFILAQLAKMSISAYQTVSDYYAKRRR